MAHHPSCLFLRKEVSGFFILQALTCQWCDGPSHSCLGAAAVCVCSQRGGFRKTSTFSGREQGTSSSWGDGGQLSHLCFEANNHPHGHLFLEALITAHHHLFLEAFLVSSIWHPISTFNALFVNGYSIADSLNSKSESSVSQTHVTITSWCCSP